MKSFLISLFVSMGITFLSVDASTAEWRKEVGVFRVGLVSAGDTQGVISRTEPFRLALSEALGLEVEIFPVKETNALIDAMISGRVEYAILSPTAYALAWVLCECVEPLVVPRSGDSTDAYRTILIARPDGPSSLAQLEGTTIGLLARDSFTGYALARHLFAKEEPQLDARALDFGVKAAGEATIDAFAAGEYGTLLGWSSMTGDPSTGYTRGTLTRLHELSGQGDERYKVIWQSPEIPHHPHVILKKLDGEAKLILRSLLTSMYENDPVAYDSIEPVFGGGFSVSRHAKFQPMVDLINSGVIEELAKKEHATE